MEANVEGIATGGAVGVGNGVELQAGGDADRVEGAPGVAGESGGGEAVPGGAQREAVDANEAAALVELGASASGPAEGARCVAGGTNID
jgi:hypothetical protein